MWQSSPSSAWQHNISDLEFDQWNFVLAPYGTHVQNQRISTILGRFLPIIWLVFVSNIIWLTRYSFWLSSIRQSRRKFQSSPVKSFDECLGWRACSNWLIFGGSEAFLSKALSFPQFQCPFSRITCAPTEAEKTRNRKTLKEGKSVIPAETSNRCLCLELVSKRGMGLFDGLYHR